MNFNQDFISFKMGKCPLRPGHILPLYGLSHILHQFLARMTRRKGKTDVITFSDLVKIPETHLETIKDGGIVFGQFSRFLFILTRLPIFDFGQRISGNQFFSESSCIKNIRSNVILLLTDISHGCLAFRHSDPRYAVRLKILCSKFLYCLTKISIRAKRSISRVFLCLPSPVPFCTLPVLSP